MIHDLRHPDCPSSEELAALIDGGIDADRAEAIREHVTRCESCYETMSESLFALTALEGIGADETIPGVVRFPVSSRRQWIPLAMAATVAVVAGLGWFAFSRGGAGRDPIARLAAVAPAKRTVVPRLSGFDYAPLAPVTRGGEGEKDWKLLAEAARIRDEAAAKPTAENLHALGVAHLLLGEYDEAIESLEQSVAKEADAKTRADLAAAYLARGIERDRPEDIEKARALAAADKTPQAAFNEAIALENLNRRDEAIEAWKRFLELDTDSGWAGEARERVKRHGR